MSFEIVNYLFDACGRKRNWWQIGNIAKVIPNTAG